jgi:tripartite ATP-independent transporter DctP family solute receptor
MKCVVVFTVIPLLMGIQQAQSADIKERTARLGHGLSDEHPQGKAARHFAELVDKASGGKIKITVLANQVLGPDTQMLTALQSGVQEFYAGSPSTLNTQVKELGFIDLPYLLANYQEAHAFYDGPALDYVNKKLEQIGIVVLGWWENGFRQVTNSRRPIKTLEDLKGLKIRTLQSPASIDFFRELGANASPLPWSELYVALETKAFDGQENPVVLMYTQRFYEVQKYMTLTSHMYFPLLFAVSKKWHDNLTPDEKAILRDAAIQTKGYQRKLAYDDVDKAMMGFKEHKMQIDELPAGDLQKMREVATAIAVKNTPNIGPEFMQLVQGELAKLRK